MWSVRVEPGDLQEVAHHARHRGRQRLATNPDSGDAMIYTIGCRLCRCYRIPLLGHLASSRQHREFVQGHVVVEHPEADLGHERELTKDVVLTGLSLGIPEDVESFDARPKWDAEAVMP
jgi:hypothetical protein